MRTPLLPAHETTAVLGHCDGCDESDIPVTEHTLTYRDDAGGGTGTAAYCASCLALARVDYAQTIAAVDGVPTEPVT